jgi:hypothetical protein
MVGFMDLVVIGPIGKIFPSPKKSVTKNRRRPKFFFGFHSSFMNFDGNSRPIYFCRGENISFVKDL